MVAREAVVPTMPREAVAPVSVTGRRSRRREKYTRRTMRRALFFYGIGIAAVLAYTYPVAMATQEGYVQDRLHVRLEAASRANEALRTEVARLRNPDRVAAYAVQSGMMMRQGAEFVSLPPEKKAAPQKSLLARITSFRFH